MTDIYLSILSPEVTIMEATVANFQMLVEVFSQDKKFSANLFENKNLRTPGNTSDLFQKLFQPSRH